MLSALLIEDALYHMDHIFAETSYYHPYVCTERLHRSMHTARHEHRWRTSHRHEGVLSALIDEDAFCHMDHIFAETSYSRPYVCT